MKKVGIISSTGRMFGRKANILSEYVANCIEDVGAMPIVIPVVKGKEKEYLEIIDSVILIDGGNISPFYYDEDPHPETGLFDFERDEFEYNITRVSIDNKIPILGISRGMQMINIVLGGSLNQKTPTILFSHDSDDYSKKIAYHKIKFEEGFFKDIFGEETIVNSYHKQSISKLAESIIATSKSSDGIIETIESYDKKILGVQFLPYLYYDNKNFKEIFRRFILFD